MRLVVITKANYVVYDGRVVVAHLVDTENHGITVADVESYRTAEYPPQQPKEKA